MTNFLTRQALHPQITSIVSHLNGLPADLLLEQSLVAVAWIMLLLYSSEVILFLRQRFYLIHNPQVKTVLNNVPVLGFCLQQAGQIWESGEHVLIRVRMMHFLFWEVKLLRLSLCLQLVLKWLIFLRKTEMKWDLEEQLFLLLLSVFVFVMEPSGKSDENNKNKK